MRTPSTPFAVLLALPLLLMACNRADHSPTAAVPGQSQEKQATSPAKELQAAPPAAGMIPPGPAGPTTESKPAPADQPQGEPKKPY